MTSPLLRSLIIWLPAGSLLGWLAGAVWVGVLGGLIAAAWQEEFRTKTKRRK